MKLKSFFQSIFFLSSGFATNEILTQLDASTLVRLIVLLALAACIYFFFGWERAR